MMGRYVKPSEFDDKSGKKLREIRHEDISKQLSDSDIVLGESTRSLMKKLESGGQKKIVLGARKFYSTTVKYLLSNFPLDNDFLKNLGCLHPNRRTESSSCLEIRRVARELPMIDSDNTDIVTDEWKLYQAEEIDDKLWKIEDEDKNIKYRRIDHYWRDVLAIPNANGSLKYETLKKVVIGALVLSHGNADVERGLSDNKKLLTKDRINLSEKSIIGNRLAKEIVKIHDPENMQPELVPITKDLVSNVRSSHMLYQQRIEEEKKQKEEQ